MVKVSKQFVDDTLWPEFLEISETLRTYLSEITDRIVHQVIHQDSSNAEVVENHLQLSHNPITADHEADSTVQSEERSGLHNEQASGEVDDNDGSSVRFKSKRKKKKKRKRR